MQEKILKICEDLCCRRLLMDEELIKTGLLYSFKIMELICTLEEEFPIVFEPEEISNLEHFSSVNSIGEIVSRKLDIKQRG